MEDNTSPWRALAEKEYHPRSAIMGATAITGLRPLHIYSDEILLSNLTNNNQKLQNISCFNRNGYFPFPSTIFRYDRIHLQKLFDQIRAFFNTKKKIYARKNSSSLMELHDSGILRYKGPPLLQNLSCRTFQFHPFIVDRLRILYYNQSFIYSNYGAAFDFHNTNATINILVIF
ncbi:hypothetical protein LOAG_01267 [Loa loa]|uniref:Uncharacterized protein n=1 Tax=Loa loa TaxID=7209 RepID=A0A1S0U9A6_LOALO|nr:hypothetical protein LOAG_01267 [Loa loa]EFO27223.1 hypothetical protein LOAG_01267 [Loa loa]